MKKSVSAEGIWRDGETLIKFVVDTVREPFLILDKELKILSANKNFYNFFQVENKDTEGQMVYDIGNKQWDIPSLRKLLENILPKETFFTDFEVTHVFPNVGKKTLLLNARMVFITPGGDRMIILAMEDVTEQKILDEKVSNYEAELERNVAKRTEELTNRVTELEKLNKIMINRETEILKLREQLNRLESRTSNTKSNKK